MKKRAQNLAAESRFALPMVMAYAIAIWLISGLLIPVIPFTAAELVRGAWVQFACFLVSAYLMVELNNSNALIRIYSRMVSCSFLVLSCAANFLFSSMAGAIVQLCVIAFYIALFRCYQNKASMGWTYYSFLCIGLASTAYVHILFYVPVLWAIMFFQLTSLSWRTFAASVLGLLTPYWFILPFYIYQGDTGTFISHVAQLAVFVRPFDYRMLSLNQLLFFIFIVALAVTGIVHYWRNSYNDRIRIRQFYGSFIGMSIVTTIFLMLQPQHYDILIRILIVNVSPLIAHFISLTHTRITNIAFYTICGVALLLTILNLWMPSLSF